MGTQPGNAPHGAPGSGGKPAAEVTRDLEGTSNGGVRDLVRAVLAGRTGMVVEDAVLVADELVSNARQHGDAPRRCRLVLLDDGRYLRIEVDDASPAQPRLRTPDTSGGRGLILVDRLASRWGVERRAHHKTVWAELVLDRPGSSGHAPHMAPVRD